MSPFDLISVVWSLRCVFIHKENCAMTRRLLLVPICPFYGERVHQCFPFTSFLPLSNTLFAVSVGINTIPSWVITAVPLPVSLSTIPLSTLLLIDGFPTRVWHYNQSTTLYCRQRHCWSNTIAIHLRYIYIYRITYTHTVGWIQHTLVDDCIPP